MTRKTVALVMLALASCAPQSGPVPDAAVLDRIERALARNPCVGDLSRWARYYQFDTVHGRADSNVILFDLHQAGKFGYRSGRYTRSPRQDLVFEIDDRDYLVAFGHYNVREGRLAVDSCGPNLDPTLQENIQSLPSAPP